MTKYLVYKNLTKDKYLIKCAKTKLVVGYADHIEMKDCEFIVSEAGRQRVIREKQKNVYAYVSGYISLAVGFESYKGRNVYTVTVGVPPMYNQQIKYDPYTYPQFYTEIDWIDDEKFDIFKSEQVILTNSGVWI